MMADLSCNPSRGFAAWSDGIVATDMEALTGLGGNMDGIVATDMEALTGLGGRAWAGGLDERAWMNIVIPKRSDDHQAG